MLNMIYIRRILFVVIVALIVSAAWLGYSTYTILADNKITPVSGPLLRNVYYPQTDGNNIEYYNGDAFVSYSPSSNSFASLSTIRGITDVSKVDWVKDGVVFSVSTISPWHPLWNQYNAYSLQNDGDREENSFSTDKTIQNYHWYLSFKKNTISLLSVGVDNALLYSTPTSDGGLFFRDAPQYARLNPDGSVERGLAPLPDQQQERKIFYADRDSYLYTSEDKDAVVVKRYTFKTGQDSQLIDRLYDTKDRSLYDQVAYRDGKLFYLEPTGSGSMSSVHEIDINSKKNRTIIERFQGTLRQTRDDIVAVHIGNEYTKLFNLTNPNRTLTIENTFTTPQSPLFTPNASYYSTLEGYVMKVGDEVATRKDVALEKKITSDNFALSRNIESLNDNSYTVTFISGSLSGRMNEVYDAVKQAGYDPFEFSFIANPGPQVSY